MEIPRNEYPRPQFVRESWECLNGEWDFSYDYGSSGEERGLWNPEAVFPYKILVPFCPESELSGLGNKDFLNTVWYQKRFNLSESQLAKRIMLNFGAVDYFCTVYLNGVKCGEHRGGYSSFGFEITGWVRSGENVITVRADDFPRSRKQPRGKQSCQYLSHACDYTRVTGIWQSVWLEFLPQSYLKSVKTITDYKSGIVTFTASIEGSSDKLSLEATVFFDGKQVSQKTIELSSQSNSFSMTLDEIRLWSPGSPCLYDVEYQLKDSGETIDTVRSYFGFRSIEIRDRGIYINGKPIFQRLILDQGYYPDGIYTAPTDEALKQDIELSMALGFNGARLHQKVFEERYYYWADKLGYLVWGEQGSWGLDLSSYEALANFLPEWLDVVERDFNHPSIVGWCPFNETQSKFAKIKTIQDGRILEHVYKITKLLDPTRPVIDTSGYLHVVTDVYDVHDYENDLDEFARHYSRLGEGKVFDQFNEGYGAYGGQPFFVSEYGGAWWAPGKTDGWGYGAPPTQESDVKERYTGLTAILLENENICGFCYTQLTDVEQEKNGLYYYNREKKFSEEVYAAIRCVNVSKAAFEAKA
mgnify:CR=1 FL=1